jgi:hypothetical protein
MWQCRHDLPPVSLLDPIGNARGLAFLEFTTPRNGPRPAPTQADRASQVWLYPAFLAFSVRRKARIIRAMLRMPLKIRDSRSPIPRIGGRFRKEAVEEWFHGETLRRRALRSDARDIKSIVVRQCNKAAVKKSDGIAGA